MADNAASGDEWAETDEERKRLYTSTWEPVDIAAEQAAATSPEDALVIAEVLRRVRDAIGGLGMRADGNLNHGDVYAALADECDRAEKEAESNG